MGFSKGNLFKDEVFREGFIGYDKEKGTVAGIRFHVRF